jgi:para-nitrobenzyl esterase
MSLYKYSALTYEGVASNVIRDFFFTCEARRLVNALSKYQDTYLYIFTFESPNWPDEWILGDYHSSELEFVFNNPWPPLIHYFDTDDQIMANTFGSYWTTFAATKNPNGYNNNNGKNNKLNSQGFMNWAKYNSSVKAYMEMNVPTQTQYNLDYNCEFWDTVKTNYNKK